MSHNPPRTAPLITTPANDRLINSHKVRVLFLFSPRQIRAARQAQQQRIISPSPLGSPAQQPAAASAAPHYCVSLSLWPLPLPPNPPGFRASAAFQACDKGPLGPQHPHAFIRLLPASSSFRPRPPCPIPRDHFTHSRTKQPESSPNASRPSVKPERYKVTLTASSPTLDL